MPDLRTLLTRLSLTQRGAARLMRRDDRNVRRWVAGDPPPDVVPVLNAVLEIQSHTGESAPVIMERLYGEA